MHEGLGAELVGNQRTLPRRRGGETRAPWSPSSWGGAGREASDCATVSPLHVAAYIRTHPGSVPTMKQHLAAIRMLGDWLVVSQVLPVNPAAAVRGPKHVVTKGATPVLSPAEARKLLESIDTATPWRTRWTGGWRWRVRVRVRRRDRAHRDLSVDCPLRPGGLELNAAVAIRSAAAEVDTALAHDDLGFEHLVDQFLGQPWRRTGRCVWSS